MELRSSEIYSRHDTGFRDLLAVVYQDGVITNANDLRAIQTIRDALNDEQVWVKQARGSVMRLDPNHWAWGILFFLALRKRGLTCVGVGRWPKMPRDEETQSTDPG